MPHVIEIAPSARAQCRGCERKIAKGELRFGEREPNAYGEGEMTLWFHLRCAAYKRPEPLLETLNESRATTAEIETAGESRSTATPDIPAAGELRSAAELGIAHPRLPRASGADRAPTGRARCRSCREIIDKDAWRIALVFFEETRFQPSGFIHAACAREYLGTIDVLDRVRHFSPDLSAAELDDFARALEAERRNA